MSEPAAALGGARHDGFVTVAELPPRGMIALRGDHADPAFKNVATGVTGLDFPARGQAVFVEDRALCWMSPDELLLMLPYDAVDGALGVIAEGLGDAHHLAADVSDARSLFRLTGLDLREVLAKQTPADMSPDALPPGRFRRTRLAQVPAAIWLREDTVAEVMCFRSVARYVFDLLKGATMPGTEVGYWRG